MNSGKPNDDQNTAQPPQTSCIVKLYDKNINAFKLNEQITVIGVLEFKIPQQENQISSVTTGVEDMEIDGQTTGNQELNADQMIDAYVEGIPNEDKIPTLHAITCRKMAILQSPDLLEYCKFDKEMLQNHD